MRQQQPALFIHQMPLDQYLQKFDSFIQYFSLHLKEHFKVQENSDLEQNKESLKLTKELEKLERS